MESFCISQTVTSHPHWPTDTDFLPQLICNTKHPLECHSFCTSGFRASCQHFIIHSHLLISAHSRLCSPFGSWHNITDRLCFIRQKHKFNFFLFFLHNLWESNYKGFFYFICRTSCFNNELAKWHFLLHHHTHTIRGDKLSIRMNQLINLSDWICRRRKH